VKIFNFRLEVDLTPFITMIHSKILSIIQEALVECIKMRDIIKT